VVATRTGLSGPLQCPTKKVFIFQVEEAAGAFREAYGACVSLFERTLEKNQ
jgi:hypothetical protein